MGAEDWNIDPELGPMLREVAADPRATLLRIARPAAFRAAFEGSLAVREGATGLLAVERELLRVHREELAYLLRRACVMLILDSSQGRRLTMRHVTDELHHDPPTRDQWLAQAQRELAVSRGEVGEDIVTVLGACVGDVAARRASIAQLAAASNRLRPTVQADVYQAEELSMSGAHPQAIATLEAVLKRGLSAAQAAIAWNNLGNARQETGDLAGAMVAYHEALGWDDLALMPWLNRLGTAWLMGDETLVVAAAEAIDSRFPSDHPAVDEYVRLHAARGGERLVDRALQRRLFARCVGRLGPVAERISNALQ